MKKNRTIRTLREIRDSFPKDKGGIFWVDLWVREISFFGAWVAIRLGLRANYVSYISIIIGVLACFSTAFYGYWGAVIGAGLFNIWLILDCVDGNVARVMHESEGYGDFVDAVSGYIVMGFGFLSTGLNVAHTGRDFKIPVLQNLDFVLLGAIASIGCVLSRLIYQKFMNVDNSVGKDTKSDSHVASLLQRVDMQIGISGLFMPMMIICSITSTMFIIPLFYAGYYLLGLIAVTFRLLLKAK